MPLWLLALLIIVAAIASSKVGNSFAFAFSSSHGTCHSSARTYLCRQLFVQVEEPNRNAIRPVRMENSCHCESTPPVPSSDGPYQYIDSSIKDILTADPLLLCVDEVPQLIDESTLQLQYSKLSEMIDGSSDDRQQASCTSDELILLASQCEAALFRHRGSGDLPSTLQAHAVDEQDILPDQIAKLLFITTNPNQKDWEIESNILLATVLAFNILESTIRKICDEKAGKAPLLKDMIEKVALIRNKGGEEDNTFAIVASILRTLLLPSGINLRNLLWHGFLPEIPRRWLALVVVLIMSLEQLDREFVHSEEPESSNISPGPDRIACRSVEVETLKKLQMLIYDEEMSGYFISYESDSDFYANFIAEVSTFVPSTHHNLLKAALCRYAHSRHAICFATIICLVLEHSLRLLWCEANTRRDDTIASIGCQRYYVTLDGIGQMNKHDVVLSPYLLSNDKSDNRAMASRNHLIDRLGGPTVAFLCDLFCTPNGPNIRSALTHGALDEMLSFELSEMVGGIGCDGEKSSLGAPFQWLSCV